ncbi:hypothetical protein ACFFJ7_20370 [Pseudochelatococcus lubricantis]|uniref:hypothetical protein n=1 Tax=Pseudochelatococcus lubricantis TaxID=1538102 RepID=UPI0035E8F965
MLGPITRQDIQNYAAVPLNNTTPALGVDLRRTSATTPQNIDLRIRNLTGGLAELMTGATFGLSARQKAERLLDMLGARLAPGEAECKHLERALQEPEKLKGLLKHKWTDCGQSEYERMSNRALLLLDLAAGVDLDSVRKRKESYVNLSPPERLACLALPSAAARGCFGRLSAEMRVEFVKLSNREREVIAASPNPEQAIRHGAQKELYRQAGVPWTNDTRPTIVNGELRELGAGAINTVYRAMADTPGRARDVVVKPLNDTVLRTVAQTIGITPPPHFELRNIATSLVAKSLGFDVVVDTQMCLYKPSRTSDNQQVGIMMEFASGKSAADQSVKTLEHGNVRREMTKLQLVDAIVGQADRHGGNMMVHLAGGNASVKGIDNDQCFGRYPSDPNGLYQSHRLINTDYDNGLRGVRLPEVIDSAIASVISKMKSADLEAMLSDKLNTAECNAAVARLTAVKKHIDTLASAGRVIRPDEWESSPLIKIHCTRENSYFERAIAGKI